MMVSSNSRVGRFQHDRQSYEKQNVRVAYFYREGDHRFAPCRIVISSRKYGNIEALKEELTQKVVLPRGVRSIFTPNGKHTIEHLEQITNEGSYVCSSSSETAKGIDVRKMQVEPQPFLASKPKVDHWKDDNRFMRTGYMADEPSDDEFGTSNDIQSRLRRKQEKQQLQRMNQEERMRGKNAAWAERVRRIALIRNGEPDIVKQYSLTTAIATNMFKVKADLSAIFGLPIERIYTIEGRLVLDVEDLFRDESLAFIVSFGDHFKAMSGYSKYANYGEKDLIKMQSDSKPRKPIQRYDTFVLPPLETSKPSTKKDQIRNHGGSPVLPAVARKPVTKQNRPAKSLLLTPAHELPSATKFRSKTMVLDRNKNVHFAKSIDESNESNSKTNSRRSRLGLEHKSSAGDTLPVIFPSVKDSEGSNSSKSKSEVGLNGMKKKRTQWRKSDIWADAEAFNSRANARFKLSNKIKAEPFRPNKAKKVEGFVRMKKKDQQQETGAQVWGIRVTTGDLPSGQSTSSITVTIYGSRGKSNTIQFTPSKKVFMPRSVEHFTARISSIGEIYKIRIESSNSGSDPDWRCDKIVMENSQKGERLEFPCRRWLSETKDDKQTVREIPALSDSRAPVPLLNYDVIVHTGNVWNSATMGTVWLEVYGDRGDTGQRVLKHSNHEVPFAKGQVDIFPLECVSLGEIRYIRLKHDPGANALGWFVENVVLRLRELDNHSQYIFPLSRWLSAHEDDGDLQVEVRPVDLNTYMRIQDNYMWPFERWKFVIPNAELVFYSCNSHRPLRITSGGFIDSRSESVDVSAVFNVASADGFNHENTVALRSVSEKSPAYIAFSQRKVVAYAEYSSACDLRVHVLPSRAINLESEKFPNNYVSVLNSGQLHPETESAMPGPAQAFFCYVKGCFRNGGIVMLCTSKIQTLCVEKDPSILTSLGRRNKLAHFRVHKVATGNIRKFESIVFPGSYLQIRLGLCNADGNGDRYCEFKVRRNRQQNYVTLESLRERGNLVGFSSSGDVQPVKIGNSNNSNVIMYPEIIEFGRRKVVEPKTVGPRKRRGFHRPNQKFHRQQVMPKRSTMWNNSRVSQFGRNDDYSNSEWEDLDRDEMRRAAQRYRRTDRNMRRPVPKATVSVPKPMPLSEASKSRLEHLSKPPARMIPKKPPPPVKRGPPKNVKPPRVANLPVPKRVAQRPHPLEFKPPSDAGEVSTEDEIESEQVSDNEESSDNDKKEAKPKRRCIIL